MLISLVTPLIEYDIPVFMTNLGMLIEKLLPIQVAYPDLKVEFYVVLQATDNVTFQKFQESTRGLYATINVIGMSETGVSAARNTALRTLGSESTSHYILFFDARIGYSEAFLQNLVSVCRVGEETLLWGAPTFGDNVEDRTAKIGTTFYKDLSDILGNPYIWNIAFRSDLLYDVRFDETRGPGKQTRVKSGEDALFLNEVLCRRGNYQVKTVSGYVNHPSRVGELDRYALYASGQVDLMCLLIEDQRLNFVVRAYAFFRYTVFVFASVRFLFMGAQGFNVFINRMSALFGRLPKIAQ